MAQVVGTGVVIETDAEPGLPPVNVDPLQLEAALLNLAANARDAMAGSGRMQIRVRRSGAWIRLSVRDEGEGFDPAVLARVFDPFFTTKPVGQGTGLGLSQVYGLVKGAGGLVEAANAPEGGGLVTLSFPPADSPAEEAEPAAAPFQRQHPVLGLSSILLVDDNDAVRATTAAFLREGGLSVIEAPDAVHALQVLETAAVEAVVSDIVMPGEDGIALAEKIRARWPTLPVLLVSGFSERAADAQARGFTVVNKPYSLPDLERRLRTLLERAAAQG
jgi:CheY-like chemotaxis protein